MFRFCSFFFTECLFDSAGYLKLLQEFGYPHDMSCKVVLPLFCFLPSFSSSETTKQNTNKTHEQNMETKALMAVHNESLNAAIEWLDVHRDDADTFVEPSAPVVAVTTTHKPAVAAVAVSNPVVHDDDIRSDGISRSKLEVERAKFEEIK